MDRELKTRLLRRLHGELSEGEARAVDELLERDAEARAELEALAATWNDLVPPAPPRAPEGFTRAVLDRVGGGAAAPWPVGARWAAPAVMAAGVVAGVWLGGSALEQEALPVPVEPSLAESYLDLLTADEDPMGGPPGDDGEDDR